MPHSLLQLVLLVAGSYAPALAAGVAIFIQKDRNAWSDLIARIRRVHASFRLYLSAIILPAVVWLIVLAFGIVFDLSRETHRWLPA